MWFFFGATPAIQSETVVFFMNSILLFKIANAQIFANWPVHKPGEGPTFRGSDHVESGFMIRLQRAQELDQRLLS